MELTRRRSLRMFLTAPLALLSLKGEAAPAASDCPKTLVRGHCAICRHYVPPRLRGFILDGPPDAYCSHRHYCGDRYLYDHLIYELKLHRNPEDGCDLFAVREELKI